MQAAQAKGYEFGTVLYMVMELSNGKWKLGFGNGAKLRRKSVVARERGRLMEKVALDNYQTVFANYFWAVNKKD